MRALVIIDIQNEYADSTCVDSTVRSASDQGLEAVLIADACAAPELQWDGVTVGADAVNAAFLAALGEDFAELTTADAFSAA